ncbi:hypothetical protein [Rubripirellula lacrimiformis]|nr:hypothetical protein [Rubripirellula lacrimiformis]
MISVRTGTGLACLAFCLALASEGMTQDVQRRSALRPRADDESKVANPFLPAAKPAQENGAGPMQDRKIADAFKQRAIDAANGGGDGANRNGRQRAGEPNAGPNADAHNRHRGDHRRPGPRYPLGPGVYGGGYGNPYFYGYTYGNPGFTIPPNYGPAYPGIGYPYYGYYGYPGYGYRYGGRTIIRQSTQKSTTPGSNYFGDPNASHYFPPIP